MFYCHANKLHADSSENSTAAVRQEKKKSVAYLQSDWCRCRANLREQITLPFFQQTQMQMLSQHQWTRAQSKCTISRSLCSYRENEPVWGRWWLSDPTRSQLGLHASAHPLTTLFSWTKSISQHDLAKMKRFRNISCRLGNKRCKLFFVASDESFISWPVE